MNISLINIDYFKQVFYKSILPLEKINKFLTFFDQENTDSATKILISILNIEIIDALLINFENIEEKKQFLRLCQDDFANSEILDYLIDKFPGSQQIIVEVIERTLLSVKKVIFQ